MRVYLLLISLYVVVIVANAQEPTGYYNNAAAKSCADLKTALKTIVTTGHTPRFYGDLWTQYQISDIKPRTIGTGSANVIYDIYSANPGGTDPYQYTPGTNQCGNYSGENNCYNREHSVPQSWFNGNTSIPGPTTDYLHIFPSDGYVNAKRSNYIYGEVATASYTSLNGSKLGTPSFAGLTGPVFEPIDSLKGDLARAFLYFVTRYEDNMTTYGNNAEAVQAFEPNTFPSIDIPYLKLMLKWHNQDAVSAKEIARNNAAYTFQGNRNPYIDHPEYVAMVWNSNCPGLTTLPVNILYFTGKLQANRVVLNWEVDNEINFKEYIVERSVNASEYTAIGDVVAANSKTYTFTDDATTIKGRRVYYRLKKVDKDGSFTYSDVFSVHIPLNIAFSVYPNPAKEVIQLQINSNANTTVQVIIADMVGKIIINKAFASNNGLIRISTNNLTNGTYLVKVFLGGEQYLQKVIIAK